MQVVRKKYQVASIKYQEGCTLPAAGRYFVPRTFFIVLGTLYNVLCAISQTPYLPN